MQKGLTLVMKHTGLSLPWYHLPPTSRRLYAAICLGLCAAGPSMAIGQDDPVSDPGEEIEVQEGSAEAQEDPASDSGMPPAGQEVTGSDAGPGVACEGLPDHGRLTEALREIVVPGDPKANGGLGNHMWAALVNRKGGICAVTRSGEEPGSQWPGSRAIAMAKAFTANGFSLPGFALSSANLYWPTQPGNSLYGAGEANPVDPTLVYSGEVADWGAEDDPAVGKAIGGSIVFGGGLALYDADGALVGGLGLSGDESCTDHVIAWKMRHALELDYIPDGVTGKGTDNIIFDITVDPATGQTKSPNGYGHPECSPRGTAIGQDLEETHPVRAVE